LDTNHIGVKIWICGFCPQTFDTEETQSNHRLLEHKIIKVTPTSHPKMLKMCDLCGKEVVNLSNHHYSHHSDEQIKCPFCSHISKNKYKLDGHIKDAHERNPCDICGMMVASRRKDRHMQQYHVNPEDRKCKCHICGKGFIDNQKLKDHLNTHTGARPYVCKVCGKDFASQGNYGAHMRQTHRGVKRSYKR
jgi:DNA-directed RNA polymerase subunit RPC12/RpoP